MFIKVFGDYGCDEDQELLINIDHIENVRSIANVKNVFEVRTHKDSYYINHKSVFKKEHELNLDFILRYLNWDIQKGG